MPTTEEWKEYAFRLDRTIDVSRVHFPLADINAPSRQNECAPPPGGSTGSMDLSSSTDSARTHPRVRPEGAFDFTEIADTMMDTGTIQDALEPGGAGLGRGILMSREWISYSDEELVLTPGLAACPKPPPKDGTKDVDRDDKPKQVRKNPNCTLCKVDGHNIFGCIETHRTARILPSV